MGERASICSSAAWFWPHDPRKASKSHRSGATSYLLSGLTRCGCCGGGYSIISADLVGCSTARKKGTCGNRTNIRRDQLEARVLNALRHHLMAPALFKEFCDEFTCEMNRLRIEGRASIDAAEAEVKQIDRELDTLLNLILKGGAAERLNEKMVGLERRQKELRAFLEGAEEPPPLLHPNMAHHYRVQVDELYVALQEDSEAKRMAAAEMLRSLVREIVLTPSRRTSGGALSRLPTGHLQCRLV